MNLKNGVQLLVYPDSLGNSLAELNYVLLRYLRQVIGSVHILPFWPSSASRGFAPLTYDEVDRAFGDWRDIDHIGKEFDLVIDFMVNDLSRQSVYFQDYLEKGTHSEYADMFLSFNKLSHDGEISEDDLGKVYTHKSHPPYHLIERADGSREKIWCTFEYEQVDLDWQSPKTREVMRRYLLKLAQSPAKMLRLHAFSYCTKQVGTDCFFLEPQVWHLLHWFQDIVSFFGLGILPEAHGHYSYNQKLSAQGYWTYDYSLPMLILHTLFHHNSVSLKNWLTICPQKQITTLDTHVGIGLSEVQDLIPPEELRNTTDILKENGAITHMPRSEYNNIDIYEANCTYYSALKCNDDAYIAARAIQFFAPGIPQVYYVGLLAGHNDLQLIQKTKNARDINRHNYDLDEVLVEIEKPVVRRLLKLMEFRSTYQAFNGQCTIEDAPDDQIKLSWTQPPYRAVLHTDLRTYATRVASYDEERKTMTEFIA